MNAPLTEDELLRLEDEHRSLRERGECVDECLSCAEIEAHPVARLLREVRRLQWLVMEHHAVGAMDGAELGDACPVCTQPKET